MEAENKIRALIVDDDADIRDMMVSIAELSGCECFSAPDGEPAWEIMKNHSPELIISDVEMPDVGGLELLKRIREQYSNIEKYIILASGNNDSELRINALEEGANDFLAKPFSARELVARIKTGIQTVLAARRLNTSVERFKSRVSQDEVMRKFKREMLNDWYQKEIARALRHGRELSCVVVTMNSDHKAELNAFEYHNEEWILRTEKLLQGSVRSCDIVGWHGEDEFCILLPETNEQGARSVADKLLDTIPLSMVSAPGKVQSIQLRFGVASYNTAASESVNLIDRAAVAARSQSDSLRINFEEGLSTSEYQ